MKCQPLFCLLTTSRVAPTDAQEWFLRGADLNASNGSPLRAINAAAQVTQPGDTVTVGAGIYHEWVSPARGGRRDK